MSGRTLWAIVKIVGISVPVTWMWLQWGREAYGRLFTQLAIPVYGFFGATSILPYGGRDRFISYLPFLILMLVTPRLSWIRRVVGVVVGFVLIFFVQVLFVYVQEVAIPDPSQVTQEGYRFYLPIMLLCDAFPLMLWAVVAHEFIREKATTLFEGTEASAGADEGAGSGAAGE